MSTSSATTRNLRRKASRPTASNVDYWAFRARADAEAADAEDRADRGR